MAQQQYMPPQPNYMPPQPQYAPPQPNYMPPQPGYMPPQPQYAPPQPNYMPPQQPGGVNVTVVNTGTTQQSKTGLIVEIILNLFGIYGVGWLISGETTVGIVLLICSFVVFWPTVILLAVLTLGFGLFCDFPLGIGLLILNAVLLNNALNRKAQQQQITVVQTR
ncbi:MAG: hypothetical protein WCD86_07910 [Ktedonobacteraceae bacterium]